MSMSSPSRATSSRSSVLSGDFAWHSAARNVVKSCLPTRSCAAACMASASSGPARARLAGIEREIGAAVEDAILIVAPDRREPRLECVRHCLRLIDRRPGAASGVG